MFLCQAQSHMQLLENSVRHTPMLSPPSPYPPSTKYANLLTRALSRETVEPWRVFHGLLGQHPAQGKPGLRVDCGCLFPEQQAMLLFR